MEVQLPAGRNTRKIETMEMNKIDTRLCHYWYRSYKMIGGARVTGIDGVVVTSDC